MVLDYEKILALGADKQMSFKVMLKSAQVARATAMRIKNGEPVTMLTAGKLAKALGVKVADLLKS